MHAHFACQNNTVSKCAVYAASHGKVEKVTCGAFFDLMTRESLVQDTIYTIFPKGWMNSPFRFEMHAYKHPSVHKDISNTYIGIVHERSHSRV